ncbi:maltokinase N-terminal cap-like domain-containing protein [Fodinicola acaciae]|uniref:maltokinase N-terminal cap-like domain-containing protein n=1 Tax=Fodinicola acaciae TaxID=2681555 RepID=UPI001FEA6AC7|nr:aminoglycoside phosphotransferase [Fodinicola acaciae]
MTASEPAKNPSSDRLCDDLAEQLAGPLAGWLPGQRWFGSKGQKILGVRPVSAYTLQDAEPQLDHVLVAVDSQDGEQLYQLLLGVRRNLPEYLEHGRIGSVRGPHGEAVAYDAVLDPDLAGRLVELMAAGAHADGLSFAAEPGVELETGLSSRPVTVEQSNTSLIFGNLYILKLFRRITAGLSADVELHRALRDMDSSHIARPLGTISGQLDGKPVTYGMLQEFLDNTSDGWAMAETSMRDLIAEADLHADEVGGDFASEAFRLGEAVASVHQDLARALGSSRLDRSGLERTVRLMHEKLDAVARSVEEVAQYAESLHRAYDDLLAIEHPVAVQRIHGDLHLGQVLRTVNGWILIDFEGEPARPLAERSAYMSPLQDVAGMLRSFDYAARHLLVGNDPDPQLDYRANEWASRNRGAFCDGYATVGPDPRDQPVLLRALELDKAVYEVAYEHNNRPTWLPIPLGSVARLATEGADLSR